MKKLMIAAAIVCATVVAQAANFTWGSAENLCIADETLEAGLAAGTTYAADGWSIDDNSWSLGYQLVLSYGGSTDTLTGTIEPGVNTDYMGGVSETLSSSLIEKGEQPYKVDYTLVYTANVKDGAGKDWVLTSDTIEGQMTVPTMGNISLSVDGVSSWSTAGTPPGPTPTPEPTSGLLLLLGVAGLALRRRRA